MNIFISWSKPRSRKVADALSELIKAVVEGAEPWVSSHIGGGEDFVSSLHNNLNRADYAIVCLTEETCDEKWIFYEVGSLVSRGVTVCPYLIDNKMKTSALPLPLPNWQAHRADKRETYVLLREIKTLTAGGRDKFDEHEFKEKFNSHWGKFDEILKRAQIKSVEEAFDFCQKRVEHIIGLARELDRYCAHLETALNHVVGSAIALYDSRRGQFKSGTVESDPALLKLLDEFEQIAWDAIENVRARFDNETDPVIGNVREFLTINYERSNLRVSLFKLAPILWDGSDVSHRQKQLEVGVKAEIGSVFFIFSQKAAECLLSSVSY